jgi:septum formation protein
VENLPDGVSVSIIRPIGDFVLASASPRRAELLRQIGADFLPRAVDLDETPLPAERPEDYVLRLALAKALAAHSQDGALPVLGADTTVVVDDSILGKPVDEDDAVAMLMALSGRHHQVFTGVAMVDGMRRETRLSVTDIVFATLTEAQCRRYWRTGEPTDKAGAYAIQGLGAVFVTRMSGSYSGVVGLPLLETRELLDLFGIAYWKRIG